MLKIKFWRIENSIVMKVLNQGEEIERGTFSFIATNGIKIKSTYYPEITEDCLFVNGITTESDNITNTINFPNVDVAKEQLALYLEAIDEYNKTLSPEGTDNEENDIEEIVVAE